MTRPHEAPATFPNGPMVEIRRSARARRAPSRYEPEERPEDDFDGSGSEDGSESGDAEEEEVEEGEVEQEGAEDASPASGSDSDDDTAGSLRDFVVDDGSSDGDAQTDTDMLEDSEPEGYTTTEDDEMDWSPGRSSRTDSESEGSDESDDDRD